MGFVTTFLQSFYHFSCFWTKLYQLYFFYLTLIIKENYFEVCGNFLLNFWSVLLKWQAKMTIYQDFEGEIRPLSRLSTCFHKYGQLHVYFDLGWLKKHWTLNFPAKGFLLQSLWKKKATRFLIHPTVLDSLFPLQIHCERKLNFYISTNI